MNKKIITTAVVFGLFGFVAGNAFWYLASPLWIDVVVEEEISASQTGTVLASGNFVDGDAIHKGSGTVTIYENDLGEKTIRFTDFNVGNGPDLKVWISDHQDPKLASDVLDGKWVSLGPLKGNIGSQNYTIPKGVSLDDVGSIVIWCEQFSVLFSPAALSFNQI